MKNTKTEDHRISHGVIAFLCTALVAMLTLSVPAHALAAETHSQMDAEDALTTIYMDQAKTENIPMSITYPSGKRILKNISDGRYSPAAVAIFLDHGYFYEEYEKFQEDDLLPENYELPSKPYSTHTSDEWLTADGTYHDRYVIVTDSPYLQIRQLAQIALENENTRVYEEYEKQLNEFDNNYVPKYLWDIRAEEAKKALVKAAQEAAGDEQQTDKGEETTENGSSDNTENNSEETTENGFSDSTKSSSSEEADINADAISDESAEADTASGDTESRNAADTE